MINSSRDYCHVQRQLMLLRNWRTRAKYMAECFGIDDVGLTLVSVDQHIENLSGELESFENVKARGDCSEEMISLRCLKNLPEDLVKARIILGWCQDTLAQKVGMKQSHIARHESGNYSTIRLSKAVEIAEVLLEAMVSEKSEYLK